MQLVMLLLIDPPLAPLPNFPRITVQLWRGVDPAHSAASRQRQAEMVWSRDWTNGATPLYIRLADIFGAQVPLVYGNNDRLYLDHAFGKGFSIHMLYNNAACWEQADSSGTLGGRVTVFFVTPSLACGWSSSLDVLVPVK